VSTVAHLLGTYLFRNGTWIYSQISALTKWHPIVLCKRTENLDVFPMDDLYSLSQLGAVKSVYNRVQRRIRGYPPYFCSIIGKRNIKVLHAHFGPVGYSSLGLAFETGIPLITTFYGHDLSQLPSQKPEWRDNFVKLFSIGSLFFVEGPFMRQQLIKLGCPEEKAQIQPLGISLEKFPFRERKLRRDGEIRVLIAGTFTEKKGIPFAVEAFCRVASRRSNLVLTIIGDARPREEELAIKREIDSTIERHRLSSRVRAMGFRAYSELIDQMYLNDILISPSVQALDGDNEGGAPVTLIEAAATGMPILSTRHCDIPSVVVDRKSGYLVTERNVDELESKLEFLISDPASWADLGREARKNIESHYDLRRTILSLEESYDRCSQE